MVQGRDSKWILREPSDPEKVDRLAAEVGIDKVLADLLIKRGVETFLRHALSSVLALTIFTILS